MLLLKEIQHGSFNGLLITSLYVTLYYTFSLNTDMLIRSTNSLFKVYKIKPFVPSRYFSFLLSKYFFILWCLNSTTNVFYMQDCMIGILDLATYYIVIWASSASPSFTNDLNSRRYRLYFGCIISSSSHLTIKVYLDDLRLRTWWKACRPSLKIALSKEDPRK